MQPLQNRNPRKLGATSLCLRVCRAKIPAGVCARSRQQETRLRILSTVLVALCASLSLEAVGRRIYDFVLWGLHERLQIKWRRVCDVFTDPQIPTRKLYVWIEEPLVLTLDRYAKFLGTTFIDHVVHQAPEFALRKDADFKERLGKNSAPAARSNLRQKQKAIPSQNRGTALLISVTQ